MSPPPNEPVNTVGRDVKASQASTKSNPAPGRVGSPALATFDDRMVGNIFLFTCVSSICTMAGALRACLTAPLVAAVVFIWESYSTRYPPIVYIVQLLVQYVQAGAAGGFAISIPLGLGAVVYICLAGLSLVPDDSLKDWYKAYRAKLAAESSRVMKLSAELGFMAITATLVPTGFFFFQLWYGSGMELLAKDNGRVLALAVLADVLASLYMKWRRFAREPAGDAGPSTDGGEGPVLEAVVVDMAKE